jgi:hypothetical protein
MKDYGRKLRATREFAAARGWTLSAHPDPALLDQLHGEPFHPAEPNPYPKVLGRHEHLLSNMLRGAYRGQSAVVFAYTRRQEVLDDSFGRRGWESSSHWIAALLDLPTSIPELQVTPRTAARPPGVAIGDPRIDEHFHVHAGDPLRAAGALRDLTPVLLNAPDRRWRISGTSILTWTHQSVPGIPLDQVDGALEQLSAIAERLRPTTSHPGP